MARRAAACMVAHCLIGLGRPGTAPTKATAIVNGAIDGFVRAGLRTLP